MKPRHAAALTLVGWYLMLPPATGQKTSTPISEWRITASYDSAAECEIAKAKGLDEAIKAYRHPQAAIEKYNPPEKMSSVEIQTLGWQFANDACVSTDDPRLKGK